MASKQSNGKPHGEKSKETEIPDGEIRAAVKPELSEQQSEELQSQERLQRLTGDREITEESELMTELSSKPEKNKPKTVDTISVSGAKEAEEEKT